MSWKCIVYEWSSVTGKFLDIVEMCFFFLLSLALSPPSSKSPNNFMILHDNIFFLPWKSARNFAPFSTYPLLKWKKRKESHSIRMDLIGNLRNICFHSLLEISVVTWLWDEGWKKGIRSVKWWERDMVINRPSR